MKSVTVLVTTKNDEKTIKRCIDSLLKQTYRRKKIYVTVADTTTDKTYDVLKKYGRKIQLEWVKGNRPRAYNKMLRKVKTDFVAFIDGDAYADRNWLKNLMKSFEKNVVAVGGRPRTPTNVNRLQELVGRELEYRFWKLPKYVARLPTMNLCVRTKYAKKEKFNEKLRVAQETDWGYRLNKYGLTVFNPNAIVWNYPRETWTGYIKQQFLYGEYVPKVYLTKRHFKKIKGDEISDQSMPVQIGLMGLVIGLFLLGTFDLVFAEIGSIFLYTLLFIFIYQSHLLSRTVADFFYYIAIFFVRTLAWGFGVLLGLTRW